MKKNFLIVFSVLGLLLVGNMYLPSSAVHAQTGPNYTNHLIDDGSFRSSNTMSATAIQTLLQNTGSSLVSVHDIEDCTSSSHPTYFAQYYTCNTSQLASKIIYDVSQAYGINPQVIIATLQKEQSLITAPTPTPSQINYAMGYGCPDSTGCSATYAGFFTQVDIATWQFRFDYERLIGNNTWWNNTSPYPCSTSTRYYNKPLLVGNNVTFMDDAGTGYATFVLPNASTATLYCYTPHVYPGSSAYYYSGSYNFVYYYDLWFGSTFFPQPIGGALYQQGSTLYLVSDLTRYQIPDMDMLANYGLNYFQVQPISDVALMGPTDGGLLSNLIYDGNNVYLVNNGVRYPISSAMCTAWGLSCTDQTIVNTLGTIFQTQYLQQGSLLSSLLKVKGTVYKLSAGQKQPIANAQSLAGLGLSSTSILAASPVNSKQPLGVLLMTTPGVVQFPPDSHIYYYDGNNYMTVNDMGTYYDWALNTAPYLTVPASSYNQTPPAITLMNSWVLSGGQKYIVDQGRKLLIPSLLVALWPDAQFTAPASPSLFASLPSETLSQLIKADPNVYVLDAAGKHYVQTIEEYISLQQTYGSPTSIKFAKVASLTQGNDALVDGDLILNSGAIYVVNNHKLTYITSPDAFNAYGYHWGAVRTYSTAITSDYPIDGFAIGNSMSSDGTHYIVSGAILYQLSAAQATDFGAIDSKFTPITKQAVKVTPPTLSRFLLNTDDGRVYYASGGAIHYVSSYASYMAYGGGNTIRVSVNTGIIQSFIIAQPI